MTPETLIQTTDTPPAVKAAPQRLVRKPERFTEADLHLLGAVLSDERYEYVDDPVFHKANPRKAVFDDAPPVRKPDTSWYHPVMQNVGDAPIKTQKTVLLTAAQERVLFLQFNYCRMQVVRLLKQVGDKRPLAEAVAREIVQWASQAEGYRDQIAQTNLALVLAMAKRTRMSDMDFGDMISEGNMALLRAVDKFDVSRGFKFSTYACRAILKAFSRAGVKHTKYRQMFPTDFDPKLEKSDFAETRRAEREDNCVDEVRQIIRENRADLTAIEQEVIEHRFAVGEKKTPDDEPMTLEQVGKIIGVTKERVRQIQNKALQKIRQTLEDHVLD
jgi:RNA polymerase sigma factor (sigma-70 family)